MSAIPGDNGRVIHLFDLAAIGAGLPVATAEARLRAALGGQDEAGEVSGALVVTAPPGTGKTTFVPPLVANVVAQSPALGPAGDGATGERAERVLLTQPRRVAVRAAARRLAELGGTDLGGAVGFTVRGERRASAATRLEVLTPGILLRRLLADPELPGVGAVVLDEVHERSLDSDLLLAMLAEVRQLRPGLRLVAMSATLDAARFAALLGPDPAAGDGAGAAPVVDVPSALHPLTVRYAPPDAARLDARGVARAFLEHVARLTADAHVDLRADALVFVPGAREVDEVVARTAALLGDGHEVLALHGRLPARAQDRATAGRGPADRPRVVVTTAIAESSLTVPGVRLVVDAGLSRQVRRDRLRDMSGLVTVSASRASADQRAGRAARQGPGTVVRAFAQTDLARMPATDPPQILTSDLTDAALLLAAWGTPRGERLALPDAPPPAEIRAAEDTLRALGLVDAAGAITPAGARVARLPVGVREARALLDGAALGSPRGAAEVVAAVADDHRISDGDVERLLRELRAGHHPGAPRWRREADRLTRLAQAGPAAQAGPVATSVQAGRPSSSRRPGRPGRSGQPADATPPQSPGTVLALGRPERIARRMGRDARTYLLASGTRAALPEGSPLRASPWLAVWEVQRTPGRAADGTGAVIRAAAPLTEDEALALAGPLLATERVARVEAGAVTVREERRLGAIVLASTPVRATPQDAGPALAAHLRETGVGALPWREGAAALRDRLALLHREFGAPWPDVSDEALAEGLEEWLGPDLSSAAGGSRAVPNLQRIDLASALRRLLPWPQAARLEDLVPQRLPVPSGSHPRVDYSPVRRGDAPVIAVKLQEMFGLADTPRIVDGRVPVVVHLLSPAGRPLAVTGDLRTFWDGPYREVRKEMRGRYPKHPWPEDPWSATATARTKRRG